MSDWSDDGLNGVPWYVPPAQWQWLNPDCETLRAALTELEVANAALVAVNASLFKENTELRAALTAANNPSAARQERRQFPGRALHRQTQPIGLITR